MDRDINEAVEQSHGCSRPKAEYDPCDFPPLRESVGGSGSVKINYVLVDYENVQVKSLELLKGEHFRVRVFLGPNNTKLPVDLVLAMQELGERAEYVVLETSGRRARKSLLHGRHPLRRCLASRFFLLPQANRKLWCFSRNPISFNPSHRN